MYEFLRQHPEVRCIVVDTLDRLTRNLSDVARARELDRELHIASQSMIWAPTVAPIGYMNALLSSGKRVIVPDPSCVELIKRCFESYAKSK